MSVTSSEDARDSGIDFQQKDIDLDWLEHQPPEHEFTEDELREMWEEEQYQKQLAVGYPWNDWGHTRCATFGRNPDLCPYTGKIVSESLPG